jgi:alpha-1,2-mannosyltransferase
VQRAGNVTVAMPAPAWLTVEETTSGQSRRWRGPAWSLFGLAVATTIFVVKIAHRMPDYEVYRTAAGRVLAAEPLYRESDGHWQFKYLPAFALVTSPLAIVPDRIARAVWFAASLGLLVVLLRTSASLIPDRLYSRGFLIGATVVLLGKFYAHELEMGQVNILMAALIVGAASSMKRGNEGIAGALVGCAIVVKPYAILFAPYLGARRRRDSVLVLAVVLAAALILPAAVYGVDGNARLLADWWETVTRSTAPNLNNTNNVSALAVSSRALGPDGPAPLLAALAIGALLATAVFVFVRRGPISSPEGLEMALLLTTIPLITPQGWDYVFLLATPGVMYLVNYRKQLPPAVRLAVVAALLIVAFSIYDLIGHRAYTTFMAWSIIPVCYVVQIVGMAVLRARGIA